MGLGFGDSGHVTRRGRCSDSISVTHQGAFDGLRCSHEGPVHGGLPAPRSRSWTLFSS